MHLAELEVRAGGAIDWRGRGRRANSTQPSLMMPMPRHARVKHHSWEPLQCQQHIRCTVRVYQKGQVPVCVPGSNWWLAGFRSMLVTDLFRRPRRCGWLQAARQRIRDCEAEVSACSPGALLLAK